MPADEELLRDVPVFKLLDDDERAALAAVFEHVAIKAGEVIFQFGDPGDSLYVVSAGKVDLFARDTLGDKIAFNIAERGDLFGEVSLLDGGPRAATAVALEDCELLTLDRADLLLFLHRKPDAALDMLTVMGQRIRQLDEMLKGRASRDFNEEIEDKRTLTEKAADWIAEFGGSIPFLLIHVAIFVAWIAWNLETPPGAPQNFAGLPVFDPFPFGLLTMAVSLEAIILSVFVLLSQNRQAEKERIKNDIEYEVNLKAELEVAELHQKADQLYAETMNRLNNIEKRLSEI